MKNLSQFRFVAFDVETTGLSPLSSGITEVGAVSYTLDGEITGTFEELANPGHPIPKAITGFTGITNNMVRDSRPSVEVVEDFLSWAGPEALFVAHNAGFDASFIATALAKAEKASPINKIIDTLRWARKLKLPVDNHKLGTLLAHISFDSGTLHRAAADALGVRELFLFLMKSSDNPDTLEKLSLYTEPQELGAFAYLEVNLPKRFEELQDAVQSGLPCTIVYSGGSKGRLPRTIIPRGVMNIKGKLYLEAWCPIDKVDKSFRLDRIKSLVLSDDLVEPDTA